MTFSFGSAARIASDGQIETLSGDELFKLETRLRPHMNEDIAWLFSPWHIRTFDQNDTVKEPDNAWFARKTAVTATVEEKRAAQLAAEHADTPVLTIVDSLGREVISIAHNRVKNAAGEPKDEKYLTFTKLDAEGKPL
jgi:hypothetical protein